MDQMTESELIEKYGELTTESDFEKHYKIHYYRTSSSAVSVTRKSDKQGGTFLYSDLNDKRVFFSFRPFN